MVNQILGFLGILAIAYVFGQIISTIKMPAILGWLIVGIVFGPYLVGMVSQDFIDSNIYKIVIHIFEAFAGVMIGSEINIIQLKSSGKQLIITTLFQSLGTFLVVSLFFMVTFLIAGKPLYLAFIFGGIALATAPAPALSIVNQYKTDGPVTRTLIPMAALDDIVGVIVFFTVISIVSASLGGDSMSWWMVVLMVLLPFAIGISVGLVFSLISKWITKAVLGHAVVLHSVPNRPFSSRGMWVLYAVCVPLRFKSVQQFARSWGENGEKSFSPKVLILF